MQTMRHGARRAVAFRLLLVTTLTVVALLVVACGKRVATGEPFEELSLLVNNRGYFDVTIYAVRSPGTPGIRVGNVSGSSAASLSIRVADLQAGGRLVLRVRAIGSRREWISPALVLGSGATARLNVYSTNSGDMSQSTLFADY